MFPPSTGPSKAPKADLYSYFDQKPRRVLLGNDDYTWWNDGAMPHLLKFTAAFQNPITGEVFFSGRYGDPKFYQTEVVTSHNDQEQVEIVWYTTKKLAADGAAARCIDCLRYREALQYGSGDIHALTRLGEDEPYTQDLAPDMPPVPPEVAQKFNHNRNKILHQNEE